MRFATEKIDCNGTYYHVIGFEGGSNGNHVLENYMSHAKQINCFNDNEILEEFIAPPSYFFETLINNHFTVVNFKESRYIDECKEVDEIYYNKFYEIPPFFIFEKD